MKKKMSKDVLELQENETVLKRVKGDYWPILRQIPGVFIFTNQRILFQGGGVVETLRIYLSISYAEIQKIKPCLALIFPTGIKIYTKEKNFRISVLKRKSVMALIIEQVGREVMK